MRPAESRLRLPRLRRRVGSSSVRDRLTTLSRGYWRFVRKHHPSLGAAPRPRVVKGSSGDSRVLRAINAIGGLVPVRGWTSFLLA